MAYHEQNFEDSDCYVFPCEAPYLFFLSESKTYSKGLETGPSGVSSTGVVENDIATFRSKAL